MTLPFMLKVEYGTSPYMQGAFSCAENPHSTFNFCVLIFPLIVVLLVANVNYILLHRDTVRLCKTLPEEKLKIISHLKSCAALYLLYLNLIWGPMLILNIVDDTVVTKNGTLSPNQRDFASVMSSWANLGGFIDSLVFFYVSTEARMRWAAYLE